MSNLALTVVLAFALIVLALIGVAIGWLITGKTKVRHCGMRGVDQKGKKCGGKASCPVCENNPANKKAKESPESPAE